MGSASDEVVSAPTGVLAAAWESDAQYYIDKYKLDQSAQDAMRELAAVSENELGKALRKLTSKAGRDDVRNPSAFVAVACRQAIGKLARKG